MGALELKNWNFTGFTAVNMSGRKVRRNFVILMVSTAVIFAFAGGFAVLQAELTTHTAEGNPLTQNVSAKTLVSLMGGDVPYLRESVDAKSKESLISQLVFELATSIDLRDTRTFLGHELPLFSLFDTEIYIASKDVTFTSIPIETPPDHKVEGEIAKEIEKAIQQGEFKEEDPKSIPPMVGEGEGVKRVFIYHSHFSESYLPELNSNNANAASHATKNITLVGKHLQRTFSKMGIGAITSNKPYPYNKAYAMSKQTVISAMKSDNNLDYFIDIHRDSRRRSDTTIVFDGKPYARLAFVVGKASKNYTNNLELAKFLHTKINEMYPGLSRGVFIKPKTRGTNGEYNQSLSPNALLVENGGIDNNFEEAYRSIDVLAKVLGEKIHHAVPVNGTNQPPKVKN